MLSRFQTSNHASAKTVEPVPTVFTSIGGADIAAVFTGKRVAGDFYDSVRTSPERVLIGLLDVAGRREDNRYILTHAQEIFRTVGSELFSSADIKESDAMSELCLRLNRGLIDVCFHRAQAGEQCHQRFAGADIALQQAQHAMRRGHIGVDLGQSLQLPGRGGKTEARERRLAQPAIAQQRPSRTAAAASAHDGEGKLAGEQFVIGQALGGAMVRHFLSACSACSAATKPGQPRLASSALSCHSGNACSRASAPTPPGA